MVAWSHDIWFCVLHRLEYSSQLTADRRAEPVLPPLIAHAASIRSKARVYEGRSAANAGLRLASLLSHAAAVEGCELVHVSLLVQEAGLFPALHSELRV